MLPNNQSFEVCLPVTNMQIPNRKDKRYGVLCIGKVRVWKASNIV